MLIKMPEINTFENLTANKFQAVKVLEEAAEMYAAFSAMQAIIIAISDKVDKGEMDEEAAGKLFNMYVGKFVEESCDVIQATVDTVYSVLGEDTEENIKGAMQYIEKKNRERGYYGNEESEQPTEG